MTAAHSGLVVLATNNGDIGGGEVMLLGLAREICALGISVLVVGPAEPSGLVDAARSAGHATLALSARNRRDYMLALHRWRRKNRGGLLWCNGLVPAAATAFMPDRIVHLHQLPQGMHVILALIAQIRAHAVLVPSRYMAARLAGTQVFENWVEEVRPAFPASGKLNDDVVRLGFLGRPSLDKGVHVLAAALQYLDAQAPGHYRLVLAGEPRFVDETSKRAVGDALAPVEHLIDRQGWMAPRDFFGLVDVMICPSVWPEPFGLVVAEAMSARVPFVISNAGALPEVAGAQHPWVATAGEAIELAVQIQDATSHSHSDILENAHERWRLHFSPSAGNERLNSLLHGLGLLAPRDVGAERP